MNFEEYEDSWKGVDVCNQHLTAAHPRLKPVLRLVTGEVLDVGCATGGVTRMVDELDDVTGVVGVDFLPSAIEKARSLFLDRTTFVCESLEELESDPFDTVLLLEFLHHTNTPQVALFAARELVAPGGRLIVTVPCRGSKVGGTVLRVYDRKSFGAEMAHAKTKGASVKIKEIKTGDHHDWLMAVVTYPEEN